MFDAMNVQKFDGNDFKCRYLKEHLNYSCVKCLLLVETANPVLNELIRIIGRISIPVAGFVWMKK